MTRRSRGRKRRSIPRRRRSQPRRGFGLGRGTRGRTTHYEVAVPLFKRGMDQSAVLPRLIDVLLLVVVGWLIYWFSSDDIFYVHGLTIEGSWRLSEIELLATSGLDGVNIFWADTQAAERAIEALPDVEDAHVRCSLPADCVVRVAERPPSLVWRQGDAQVWIGADGTVLPARGDLPYAMVLDAAGSTALKPGDEIDAALVLAVEELEDLQPEIRTYSYSEEYGLSFRSPYGWSVRLGDGREVEKKLHLVNALTEYFVSHGITPAYLDVRYPNAPYYGE